MHGVYNLLTRPWMCQYQSCVHQGISFSSRLPPLIRRHSLKRNTVVASVVFGKKTKHSYIGTWGGNEAYLLLQEMVKVNAHDEDDSMFMFFFISL